MKILDVVLPFIMIPCLASGFEITKPGADSVVDIFPLAIGNQWVYSHYYNYGDIGGVIDSYIDTGSVTLEVIGRIATTNVVRWTIREVLTHWEQTNGMPWSGPSTMTTTFELVEMDSGNHLLYRTGQSTDMRTSALPIPSNLADTGKVYRYAPVDSSGTIVIHSYVDPGAPVFGYTLQQGVGLTQSFVGDGCTCIPWWSCQHSLRSVIVTHAPARVTTLPMQDFTLFQNFPNPFNPSTGIRYSVPFSTGRDLVTTGGREGRASGNSRVRIAVYDVLGREVAVLVDAMQTPGEHEVRFDGSNLASGMYLYRLTAGSNRLTRSMMLLK